MALAAALAFVIGVVLGMLGGGGAILTLPMLAYAVGVEPKEAIATSLVVVGGTALVGMLVHARAKHVRWKVGALFASTAMAGAYAGGRLARYVPARALLLVFAALMITTAILMLRPAREDKDEPARALRPLTVLALGALVGVISGLVGAGGGFLIVPALVLFGGVPTREAIGTSLLVIGLQSLAGFLGHAASVTLDLALIAWVTGASIVGSLLGASLAERVPVQALRKAFAVLVLAMGFFVLFKQIA